MGTYIPIPGTEDLLLLEDTPEADGYFASVYRCDEDGRTRWTALPPEGIQDAWTNVAIKGEIIEAHSWSSWMVILDPDTGAELSRHFTK